MAHHTRQNKSNEKGGVNKREKRKEQVKLAMRRHRSKMSEEQLEERRRKDRERYKRKKEQGLIKNISELTPRAQRTVRKLWKERSKRYRDKKKSMERIRQQTENFIDNETPPESPIPSSSRSRAEYGRNIGMKNRRRLKLENRLLQQKLRLMENRVKKYQMLYARAVAKAKILINKKDQINKRKRKIDLIKKQIEDFLEKDECSRLTAGKKETITRNKVKKQIRFLNDTLLSLYTKFKDTVNYNISYSLFCRYRPFWIISPTLRQRDTCLCIHHANMELIVTALKTAKIIKESTPVAVVKSICCEGKLKEVCLLRKCKHCQNKKIHFNNSQNNYPITYLRWITKKFPVSIKGKEKLCQKTIKEKILSQKKDLIVQLQSKLPNFMKHLNNIYHQYQAINYVKRHINDEIALLHIDFAENYICKYAEEVQAVHFGASKPQISLHTAVLYHHGEFGSAITPFCTISPNLRHDPISICNHLLPIIKIIKDSYPNLKTMHFVSDGPSSQYRNKSMFFLMANFLAVKLSVENLIWHYNEAGHGKGSPDGIGAVVKRTADQSVARGHDIANFDQLIQCLNENCKGVQIIPIDEENITSIEDLMSKSLTPTFKGTLNVHQITWNSNSPGLLHARRLSCMDCFPHQICPHYELGVINTEPARTCFQGNLQSSSPHSEYYSDTDTIETISSLEDISTEIPLHTQIYGRCSSLQETIDSIVDSKSDDPSLIEHVSTERNSELDMPANDSDVHNATDLNDFTKKTKPVTVSVLSKRSRNFYYRSNSSDDSLEKVIKKERFINSTINGVKMKQRQFSNKHVRLQSSSSDENIF